MSDEKTWMGQYAQTIGELKVMIGDMDDDLPLIKQADDEGNGFSLVHGVEKIIVRDPNCRELENCNFYEEDPEAYGFEEDEWEEMQNDKRHHAVVVY